MSAITRIAAERRRQIEQEGWTLEHDDMHSKGALATAAAALAGAHLGKVRERWGLVHKHRGNRVRQLIIAGALIVAEIERLERAKHRQLGLPLKRRR